MRPMRMTAVSNSDRAYTIITLMKKCSAVLLSNPPVRTPAGLPEAPLSSLPDQNQYTPA